ncbi:MAG TPA: FliH/SctL family protein [Candidatus Binatia bacterium]
MYKLVLKNSLDPNDIQPYRELDLGRPSDEPVAAAPEVETVEVEALDLDALGPLVCLTVAQQKAEEILAAARSGVESLRKEAYEEGKSLGREEARNEILPALIGFAQAGQSLIVFEEQMVTRFTPQMVRLALAIAEKIVGKAVAEDPEIIASVLERARKEVPDARLVRVRLHPADYNVLVEMRSDLVRAGEEGGRKVEVLASDEIGRGGCRIETEIGSVDASIPTQFQEIKRQLLDE